MILAGVLMSREEMLRQTAPQHDMFGGCVMCRGKAGKSFYLPVIDLNDSPYAVLGKLGS